MATRGVSLVLRLARERRQGAASAGNHAASASPTRAVPPVGLLVVWALTSGIAVWLCYGFALRLPFFFDDLPVLSWLDGHSLGRIWLGQDGGYYRPLPYVLHKLGLALPYGMRQTVLHAVNLVCLWGSALTLGALVWHFEQDAPQALVASLLLVFYPLSIQAIPWVTALGHPLTLALCLWGVWAALMAADRGTLGWHVNALAAILLAPLAHESGAVAGALALSALALRHGPNWLKLVPGLAGIAVNVATVLARSLLPGVTPAATLAGWQDLYPNLIYFVQGLLYPLGPVVRIATRDHGWHDLGTYSILFLVAVPCAVLLARRAKRVRLMTLGLVWWLLGGLAAIVGLRYSSLYISSRVYVLSAAGAAIFVASLIASLASLCRRTLLQRGVCVGLAVLVMVQSYGYLAHMRRLYDEIAYVYSQVSAVAQANDESFRLGLVNIPRGLMWEDRTFPLTTDDVLFVPPYSDLTEWVTVNLGYRDVQAVSVGWIARETNPTWLSQGPWLGPLEFRDWALTRDALWVVRYADDRGRFVVEPAGTLRQADGDAAWPPWAEFPDGPLLESAKLERLSDRRWQLVLDWRGRAPVEATIFVHVVAGDGALIAQADGHALGGTLPLEAWQPGDRVRDLRLLALPEGTAGPVSVYVGLYQGEHRFAAYVRGERAKGDAVLVGQTLP